MSLNFMMMAPFTMTLHKRVVLTAFLLLIVSLLHVVVAAPVMTDETGDNTEKGPDMPQLQDNSAGKDTHELNGGIDGESPHQNGEDEQKTEWTGDLSDGKAGPVVGDNTQPVSKLGNEGAGKDTNDLNGDIDGESPHQNGEDEQKTEWTGDLSDGKAGPVVGDNTQPWGLDQQGDPVSDTKNPGEVLVQAEDKDQDEYQEEYADMGWVPDTKEQVANEESSSDDFEPSDSEDEENVNGGVFEENGEDQNEVVVKGKTRKPEDASGGNKGQAKSPSENLSYIYEEETASSHFMAYSLIAILVIMATYILYHNKQRIIAVIIEGRNSNGRRNRNKDGYQKLDQNLSEAMPSLNSQTAKDYKF